MPSSDWRSLLQRAWIVFSQLTVYFQCCLVSQITAFDAASAVEGSDSTSPVAHSMPPELILYIIELVANTATMIQPLDSDSAYPEMPAKPDFSALSGLHGSCHRYHTAVQKAWYGILYIRAPEDWEMVDQLGVSIYVREIRVTAAALGENLRHDAFMKFSNLHTAFLDAHNDFVTTLPSSAENGSPRPIGRYHLVAPCLPPSLRRLYITNAHGPDIAVIQMLITYCPNLMELSISRCTMFSPRFRPDGSSHGAGCRFWDRFPDDHDSYFAGEGIEDYASSLSHELKLLSNLETLHMGLYLTPHEAISEHLHQHSKPEEPASSVWCSPCDTCVNRFKPRTQAAETAASDILFNAMPNLHLVSWASFFTSDRLGAVEYTYDRSHSNPNSCKC
ncbi:hypothetical protein BDV93DRAFT_557423 [Ceratobasidium sp. AG-I]|nr:hypothetical protein BDV93DRAFT_557423 [Ceratobasidium sp. AG-I]